MSDLSVKSAKHQIGHILEVTFSDGKIVHVDFAPFIFSNEHPDYMKYRSISEFMNFSIIDGNINWDDYSMIFPVIDIYNNRLMRNS